MNEEEEDNSKPPQDQPKGQPQVEDTGYLECPVCHKKVKKMGQHGHFQAAHPKEDYDEYKDQFTPTAPPEGVREEEEKEEEEQVSAEDISPEEQLKKEAIEYMKDNFPLIPGFPSRNKKKLNFLIRLFKNQKLWESPEKFRRFARKIKSFCPKVKWVALNPILDDIWGIILEWKSQPPQGYSPRRGNRQPQRSRTPQNSRSQSGSWNPPGNNQYPPTNSNQGGQWRQPQPIPQQSRPPSRKDRALMKRLNTLEKTVRQLAGVLEKNKEDDNKIPVKIKGHEVMLPPLQALSFLERQGGDKIGEKYEKRINSLQKELRNAKDNLQQEKVSDLKERIDDLQRSLATVRSSKPNEEKLVKEAAKRFKTGRTPYDLMDKGMGMVDKRTGQILGKITLPSPPQEGPPQLGKQKTEKKAEKMKKQIRQGREEKKLENEFLETVE